MGDIDDCYDILEMKGWGGGAEWDTGTGTNKRRTRIFSIDFDSNFEVDDINLFNADMLNNHVNSGEYSVELRPTRDRGMSFEFFSYNQEQLEVGTIDAESGVFHTNEVLTTVTVPSNYKRERGDSIIYSPTSFADGGIHDVSGLRAAMSASKSASKSTGGNMDDDDDDYGSDSDDDAALDDVDEDDDEDNDDNDDDNEFTVQLTRKINMTLGSRSDVMLNSSTKKQIVRVVNKGVNKYSSNGYNANNLIINKNGSNATIATNSRNKKQKMSNQFNHMEALPETPMMKNGDGASTASGMNTPKGRRSPKMSTAAIRNKYSTPPPTGATATVASASAKGKKTSTPKKNLIKSSSVGSKSLSKAHLSGYTSNSTTATTTTASSHPSHANECVGNPSDGLILSGPDGSEFYANSAVIILTVASCYLGGKVIGTSGEIPLANINVLNKMNRVGVYTPEQRVARVEKFHKKRRARVWRKRIKYDCRKKLADSRPRVKGRFVKRTEDGDETIIDGIDDDNGSVKIDADSEDWKDDVNDEYEGVLFDRENLF
jgi:hypothetical protein